MHRELIYNFVQQNFSKYYFEKNTYVSSFCNYLQFRDENVTQ